MSDKGWRHAKRQRSGLRPGQQTPRLVIVITDDSKSQCNPPRIISQAKLIKTSGGNLLNVQALLFYPELTTLTLN